MSDKRKQSNANGIKIVAIFLTIVGSAIIVYMLLNLFINMPGPEYGITFSYLIPILIIGFFIIILGIILYRGISINSRNHHRYRAPFTDDTKYYGSENKLACPTCRQYNSPQARFCNQCGAELVNICQYCDHENDYGADYCSNCGSKIIKQR